LNARAISARSWRAAATTGMATVRADDMNMVLYERLNSAAPFAVAVV